MLGLRFRKCLGLGFRVSEMLGLSRGDLRGAVRGFLEFLRTLLFVCIAAAWIPGSDGKRSAGNALPAIGGLPFISTLKLEQLFHLWLGITLRCFDFAQCPCIAMSDGSTKSWGGMLKSRHLPAQSLKSQFRPTAHSRLEFRGLESWGLGVWGLGA